MFCAHTYITKQFTTTISTNTEKYSSNNKIFINYLGFLKGKKKKKTTLPHILGVICLNTRPNILNGESIHSLACFDVEGSLSESKQLNKCVYASNAQMHFAAIVQIYCLTAYNVMNLNPPTTDLHLSVPGSYDIFFIDGRVLLCHFNILARL